MRVAALALAGLMGLASCSDLDFVAIEDPQPDRPEARVWVRYVHRDSVRLSVDVLLSEWTEAPAGDVQFGDLAVPLIPIGRVHQVLFHLEATLAPEDFASPRTLSIPPPAGGADLALALEVPVQTRVGPPDICVDGAELVFETLSSPLPDGALAAWVLRIWSAPPAPEGPTQLEWRGAGLATELRVPAVLFPAGDTIRAGLRTDVRQEIEDSAVPATVQVQFVTEWEILVRPEGCGSA